MADQTIDQEIAGAMKAAGVRIWWILLLRGILAVVFGVLALIAPAAALLGIAFVFAAYAIIDGIMLVAHSFRVRATDKRWGWLLAQGIIAVLAGLVAAIFPGLAGFFGGLFVIWTIVFYAIMFGIAGFPAAAAVSDTGRKVYGIIAAVLSILAGVLLGVLALVNPASSVLSLIWVAGVYAIIFGVVLVVIAIAARVRASNAGKA